MTTAVRKMTTPSEELRAVGAPQQVLDAASECEEFYQAGLTPPRELVDLIRSWVYKGQDRYGK